MYPLQKPRIVLTLFFFMIWMFIGGVAFAQPDTTPSTIRMGVQPLAVPSGTVLIVVARDLLLQQRLAAIGSNVSFSHYLKGKEINDALLSYQLDGGAAGDLPMIQAASTGKVVVSALAKTAFASIVAREPLTIKQLQGKKIANVAESSSHFVLLTALNNVGLSEKNVTLVPMEIHEMSLALANHQVDAFAAWEPTPSQALQQHPDFIVIHRGLTNSYYYFTRSFATQRKTELLEILAAIVRAMNWMRSSLDHITRACQWNLNDAEQFLQQKGDFDLNQCIEITQRDLLQTSPMSRIPVSYFAPSGLAVEQFNFLQAIGKIATPNSLEKLVSAFKPDDLEYVLTSPKIFQLQHNMYTP